MGILNIYDYGPEPAEINKKQPRWNLNVLGFWKEHFSTSRP